MLQNLPQVAAWLQFDKSLSLALFARLWQAISGPITIALLVWTMNKEEQGLFSSIFSIAAIQPLFELGLGSVLIGQAGNLLGRSPSSRVAEVAANTVADSQDELYGLARAALKWYGTIAVLYVTTAWAMGWKVLSGSGTLLVDWRLPLLISVALAGVSLAVSPRVYVLEGGGEREYVYRWRLWQTVAGSLTMWMALLLDLKMWGVVAVFAIGASFQIAVAFGPRAQKLLGRRSGSAGRLQMNWLSKIAPLQWRTAAGSAAHYLASQLIAIYVVNYHGVRVAAPLLLTLQITVAVQALALVWAQTKFPLISRLQAEQQREQAGTLWRQTALVSSGLLVLAMLGLAAAVGSLELFQRGWEERFIPPALILVLGVGYLANHLLALQAFYVLSRGAKPLVVAAVTGLLWTAAWVWWGGKYYSVTGVVTAYSLSMIFVTLPLHSWAYMKFRAATE